MTGTSDVVKGRMKEAAGALTGSDRLRAEGRSDQAVGRIKQSVQRMSNALKKAVKKVFG